MSLERYFTTLTGQVRDTSQVTWAGRAGQGLQNPDQAPNPGEATPAAEISRALRSENCLRDLDRKALVARLAWTWAR